MDVVNRNDFPSGTTVYIRDKPASEMELSIISYDSSSTETKHLSNVFELIQNKDDSKISWININGLKDIASIRQLGELFSIHPLTIEDILNTEQQPKIEFFEDYRFFSVKTIQLEKKANHEQQKKKNIFRLFKKDDEQPEETEKFFIKQVSIIIMKNVVLTFQEISGESFERVRKKLMNDIGEIRKMGTDYLAYTIIDAIVDEYFLVLNHLEEEIVDFEDRAATTNDETFIGELQDTKKYLLKIKRAISPLKDNIITIIHHAGFFQTDELKPFLQDLIENLNHETIILENYREWLTNIMDVNLSVLTYQMNKVMKVLATISTIFIPLTFVAGVYGMNFEFMPELHLKFGYPLILGGMGIIASIMILIFKIRHWF